MKDSTQVSKGDVEQSQGSRENGPTEQEEQSRTSEPESCQDGTSALSGLTGMLERQSRTTAFGEPSSTLQGSLREISDSLSADELKQMKFLVRGKVDGFRLAKIREGFELFEELKTGGRYPCTYIVWLLGRVQRYDLLKKLELPFLDDTMSGSASLQTRLVPASSSFTKFSDNSLSSNSSDSTSLATHSICEAEQPDDILQDLSDHSSGITAINSLAAGCEISSDTGGVNPTSSGLISNTVSVSGNGDAEVLEQCEQMEERSANLCNKALRSYHLEQPGTFDLNSAEMNFPHSCSTAQDGSGLPVGALVTHSVPGRLAAGVSSGSNTDWDRLGARPKRVQGQGPQPEPILPRLISPVSGGLSSDFLARHSQDRTLQEGLCSSGSTGALVASSSTGCLVLDCANSNTLTHMGGPQPEPILPEVPVMIPVSDGLVGDFLARHTQDRTLLQGLCRDGDEAVYGTYSCASSSADRSFGAVVNSISTGCSTLDSVLTLGPCCDVSDNNHTADFMLNGRSGSHSLPLDDSLVALEQHMAEVCAHLEEVLRERQERELFARQIETRVQMIREQRERERREREGREVEQAERWPQQQDAIFAPSPWLCNHYMRYCRVRFPCCTQFYPCHRCHNNSRACDNEEAKACHATHLKCSHCQHEQELLQFPVDGKCSNCRLKMFPKFCSTCNHFVGLDDSPCYCQICIMWGTVCSPSCGQIPEL